MTFKKISRDVIAVVILLIICNLIIHLLKAKNIRTSSLNQKCEEILSIPLNTEFDVIFLGDSRSAEIDISCISKHLEIDEKNIYNASIIAGCWIGSYSMLSKLSNHIHKNTKIIICLSEYWLERPNVEEKLGLYPYFIDYFKFNFLYGIKSFIPIALKRHNISDRINKNINVLLSKLINEKNQPLNYPINKDKVFSIGFGDLSLCNVDLWFSEINIIESEDNLVFARNSLDLIQNISKEITLIYLPNAASRCKHVTKYYPDRQEKFFKKVENVCNQKSLQFLNFKNLLIEDQYYKDYHHWNDQGSQLGSKLIAERLKLLFK
tara:strand:+ start:862 stop:1824 length:963 start_codon:yes stop_codon:yes gene_type:complete